MNVAHATITFSGKMGSNMGYNGWVQLSIASGSERYRLDPQGGSLYSWPADLSCVAVTGTPAMCATIRIRDLERGLKPVKLFRKGQSAAARDTSTLLPSHTAVHPAPTLLRIKCMRSSVQHLNPLSSMSGNVARPSPDILTYRHGSRMVYVTPAETFEARLQFFFGMIPGSLIGS
jgi:hypothetical protein